MTKGLLWALAAGAAAAEPWPFEGRWDCGVGTFAFTATTYDAGEGPLPIEGVEMDGSSYLLSFADGYRIGLSSVTATTMTWFSFETGDSFDCARAD